MRTQSEGAMPGLRCRSDREIDVGDADPCTAKAANAGEPSGTTVKHKRRRPAEFSGYENGCHDQRESVARTCRQLEVLRAGVFNNRRHGMR